MSQVTEACDDDVDDDDTRQDKTVEDEPRLALINY